MRFHSNYFFLNTYIYRQTNGYMEYCEKFSSFRDKLLNLFRFIKIFNMCKFSFFFSFIDLCCQNITTIRCSLLWCLINFTLSIKNTIVIQIYKLDPSVLVRILIREITIFSPREKAFFPASSPRIQIRDATSNCVFNRSVCETLPGGHVFVESADDFV